MDGKDEGISLGQLFKVMFGRNKKRKITFGLVFLCVFIVLFIGIKFIYSRSNDTYVAKFNWTAVGLSDGKYVDGSTFDYKSLQTKDVLNEVKKKDEKFSSINIDKLTGDLSVTFVQEKDKNDVVTDSYYQISVKKKYFANYEVAQEFVAAVAKYPIDQTIKKLDSVNLTSNFTAFDNSTIYDNQVEYLNNQYNLLINQYKSLVEAYGDVTSTYKDSSIAVTSIRQYLITYYNNYSLSMLQSEINNYGYVKDYTYYEATIKANLADELQEYKINLSKIKALENARDSLIKTATNTGLQDLQLESFNKQIVDLISENKNIINKMNVNLRKLARNVKSYPNEESLENEFKEIALIFNQEDNDSTNDDTTEKAFSSIYQNVLTGDVTSFEQKLSKYYTDLKNTYTKDFAECEKEVVTNYSHTSFYNGSVIELNQKLNTAKIVIISILAGLVVACIVNLVLDYSHLHDEINKNDNE